MPLPALAVALPLRHSSPARAALTLRHPSRRYQGGQITGGAGACCNIIFALWCPACVSICCMPFALADAPCACALCAPGGAGVGGAGGARCAVHGMCVGCDALCLDTLCTLLSVLVERRRRGKHRRRGQHGHRRSWCVMRHLETLFGLHTCVAAIPALNLLFAHAHYMC